MQTIVFKNEEQTKAFAHDLAKLCQPGDILLLTGDLGAGKTTFTKGFAAGLGITQMIKSPTYTLIKEYDDGHIPLYHMDVYRLTEGASDLGLDDYLEGDGICLIEWGSMIKQEVFTPYFELFLQTTTNNDRELYMTISNPILTKRLDDMLALMRRHQEA